MFSAQSASPNRKFFPGGPDIPKVSVNSVLSVLKPHFTASSTAPNESKHRGIPALERVETSKRSHYIPCIFSFLQTPISAKPFFSSRYKYLGVFLSSLGINANSRRRLPLRGPAIAGTIRVPNSALSGAKEGSRCDD